MRKNISSQRTKQRMANALEKLLEKKPLEKITVSDVTDLCEINRQTFYYHFHDIYDLTKWLILSYTEKDIGANIKNNNWHEAFLATAHFLKKKKNIFLGIVSSVGNFYVTNFLVDMIRPYISKFIAENAKKIEQVDDRYTEFLADYYTVAFAGILLGWIITDCDSKIDSDDLLDLIDITIQDTLDPAVERYLDKYSKKK